MFGWTIRPRIFDNGISESYLSDMAAKGWYLRKLGYNAALFKKGAPAQVRYGVDVLAGERRKLDEKRDSRHIQEYLQICEEGGWQFVDCDKTFYVFVAKDEAASPLQTDPAAYRSTVFSQRKRSLLRLFLAFALLWPVLEKVLFFPHRFLAWEYGPMLWLESIFLTADILFRLGYMLWALIRERKTLSKGLVPEKAYGRWCVWLVFGMEAAMFAVMMAAWVQGMGIRKWLLPVFVLLTLPLMYITPDILEKLGWERLRCSRYASEWLGRAPVLALIALTPFATSGLMGNARAGSNQKPEAQPPWQPVVTAADFGWDGEEEYSSYAESFCAQSYERREGAEEEALRSVLYVSGMPVLLDLFYQKGPFASAWWNEEQEVQAQGRPDAGALGLTDALAWQTGTQRYHYLLRAEGRILYLMAGQELTESQLALAAGRLIALTPD